MTLRPLLLIVVLLAGCSRPAETTADRPEPTKQTSAAKRKPAKPAEQAKATPKAEPKTEPDPEPAERPEPPPVVKVPKKEPAPPPAKEETIRVKVEVEDENTPASAAKKLLQNPWWSKKATEVEANKILKWMTTRGDGVLFFNADGEMFPVHGNAMVRPKRYDWQDFYIAMASARKLHPEVLGMGDRLKMVVMPQMPGDRMTVPEAVRYFEDMMRVPDFAQCQKMASQPFDTLKKNGGFYPPRP